MTRDSLSATIEPWIVRDKKFISTLLSYSAILAIALNLFYVAFLPLGATATFSYLFINGTFVGNALLKKERFMLKLLIGILLLLAFLALTSWVVIVALSDLTAVSSMAVLFIVATLSSFLNRMKTKQP